MASLNPRRNTAASRASRTSVTRYVLALQPARGKRVLDRVRRGVGGRQRHGDHEVGRGEPQQDQDEELAAPARQQALEHGDGAFAAVALPGHPAVDRQGAEQGHGHQHQRRQRGEHARRPGRRSPAGSPGWRSSRRRSGTSPATTECFFRWAIAHRAGPLMGPLAVLQAEQQPAPEVLPAPRAAVPKDRPAACSAWSSMPLRAVCSTAITPDDIPGRTP